MSSRPVVVVRGVLERLLELAAGDPQVGLADVVDREPGVRVRASRDARAVGLGQRGALLERERVVGHREVLDLGDERLQVRGASVPSLWWYQAVAAKVGSAST